MDSVSHQVSMLHFPFHLIVKLRWIFLISHGYENNFKQVEHFSYEVF